MGFIVEVEKCNFNELVTNLCDKYKIKDKELLEKILLEFGELIGDTYVIMHNEYWEDGICTWNCFRLINRVFKIEEDKDSYDEFLHLSKTMKGYMEVDEAIDKLGLKAYLESEVE